MAPLTSLVLLTTFISSISAAPTVVKVQPVNLTVPPTLNTTYNGWATWFDDHRGACKGIEYSFDEPIAAINRAQFGNGTFVCGKYVEVTREDDPKVTHSFKVVDVCDECSENSLDFSRTAIDQFSDEGMLKINWKLIESPEEADKPEPTSAPKPTSTSISNIQVPSQVSKAHGSKRYSGRMTWFSDTSGSCGRRFSQSDMIAAMNEHQMGRKIWGKESRCGQKVRVWNGKTSVVLTIVDTCPKRYCNRGALDLSRAAFRRFAPLSKGVLHLNWEFVN